ncbi:MULTISPECIES: dynamin family protein [unclassified Acinetobacter]|uniref:dynamin family protein n=1 Tax=unclassified Acinetobacter TaxID=196816 RepID=UPI0024487DE9|nr:MULTISPECIES: dynamin family protein [unclassified Acinetobacter]MDH0033073.1 dynamin family protein [Acinetobacter sp. GD04021]MDH0888433.1 dynamin family protein [Acinetobacter sp. GD03873]MDH1084573.1 dynamin family protein [Acinetobacter sp. GD03983]MDH2191524.1 dynamin family protein [Acinetobacter sp. GD03645]MDH2205357.1 dynamin family protein [Acinetobacter sp. GD03647]
MSQQQCMNLEKLFSTSLLRNNKVINDLVGLQNELDDVTQHLAKIKSKQMTTLKVFLMGEVKAGKSTLINALVGQNVSPVNVLEATATIWEIGYADQPKATVIYKNGSNHDISHAEMMSLYGTDADILKQAGEINKIIIKTNQHQFKELLLIDSPGLGTVTSQNEELTTSIMQDVDLALWIFNANHLGQTNILEKIEELTKLGKPIVAVINKIDETEDRPEQLVRYLRRNSEEYFQEIFAVSAYKALKQPKNNEFSEYFDEFKQYLLEQISRKASQVKADSVESSLRALINREKVLHESAARKLNKLQQEQQDYVNDLNYQEKRFKDDIGITIEMKCHELSSDIQLGNKISGGNAPGSLAQDHLNHLNNVIQDHYGAKFRNIFDETNQKAEQRMINFQQNEWLSINTATQNGGDIDGVFKTAATSAAIHAGTRLATIAGTAGLGTAAGAAFATVGAALATVALPMVIAGVAASLISNLGKSEQRNNHMDTQVQHLQTQIASQIKNQLLDEYSNRIKINFNHLIKEHEKLIFSGLDKTQIRQYERELEDYARRVSLVE